MSNFRKLDNKWQQGFFLAVGLDTDPEKIPSHLLAQSKDIFEAMLTFNTSIVDATRDSVAAYKLNSAFYEKHGASGLELMKKTVEYIKKTAPDVFLIADAKRGDIGNTNEGYLYFIKELSFDSLTIHGYLGREANEPFLKHTDKLFFVLAKTSNSGSGEFQDLETAGLPLYLQVAKNIKEKWNAGGNCGLVVGATFPEHLLRARDMAGNGAIFLIPGIGAQGGDLQAVIQCGLNDDRGGAIINMSRGVIYASAGEDYAEAARTEVEKFNKEVKEYLKLPRITWEESRRTAYQKRTLEIFEKTSAVLTGDHFVYQTGDHGSAYVAKDKINPDPLYINEVGLMLADMIKDKEIDTVVVPAVGGIVLGHIVAKYLSYFKGRTIHSVFIEKGGKDETGKDTFKITRGYEAYLAGKNVAVVEDTVNTGHSVKKVIDCARAAGAKVTAVAIICNRGGVVASDLDESATLTSLTDLHFEKYKPADCPLCKDGVPINTKFGHGKAVSKPKV